MPANPPDTSDWPIADDIDFATEVDEDRESMPATRENHRPEFQLLTDAELESVPAPEYGVEGLLVRESFAFAFGPPASGKTFFAVEVARSIAAGRRALGLRTVQGPVVYIAGEGGKRGIAKRLRAWSAANNDGAAVPDFYVVPRPVPMLDAVAVARFVADVRATVGKHVEMFVIDTLARCTGGGDENSASDMGRFVSACDVLRGSFGATVLAVHHSGKTADAGMRGSTALHGAADTELRGQAIAKDDKLVMWYISANRDEEVFDDPFRFDIERQPNEHLAFGGGGPHFCLGASLARMELRVLFEELARRVPVLRSLGHPAPLRSNVVAGIKHLPVDLSASPVRSG